AEAPEDGHEEEEEGEDGDDGEECAAPASGLVGWSFGDGLSAALELRLPFRSRCRHLAALRARSGARTMQRAHQGRLGEQATPGGILIRGSPASPGPRGNAPGSAFSRAPSALRL